MKLSPAFPYWSEGPRRAERMLVQHTVPWHRAGFVLLVFHLWAQCRGEREREIQLPGFIAVGLCHPLNIEQNSAKRHSNSYVKIDAVLCFQASSCLLWYMGFSREAVTWPGYKTVQFLEKVLSISVDVSRGSQAALLHEKSRKQSVIPFWCGLAS